jgi:hypothetical protein
MWILRRCSQAHSVAVLLVTDSQVLWENPDVFWAKKIIAFHFYVVKVAFVIYNGNFTGEVEPT